MFYGVVAIITPEIFTINLLTVQKMADDEPFMVTRANPKSHTLSLQSELANMFFGFKSRWNTLAAWKQMKKISMYI
jgi:hypothetical protein